MSASSGPRSWWELHLRKARGEALTEQELREYDQEMARQDREAPPLTGDLGELRNLREKVLALAQGNATLRNRIGELENEIKAVEQSLGRQAREALGVAE
jgi:hypothetical protein